MGGSRTTSQAHGAGYRRERGVDRQCEDRERPQSEAERGDCRGDLSGGGWGSGGEAVEEGDEAEGERAGFGLRDGFA